MGADDVAKNFLLEMHYENPDNIAGNYETLLLQRFQVVKVYPTTDNLQKYSSLYSFSWFSQTKKVHDRLAKVRKYSTVAHLSVTR